LAVEHYGWPSIAARLLANYDALVTAPSDQIEPPAPAGTTTEGALNGVRDALR